MRRCYITDSRSAGSQERMLEYVRRAVRDSVEMIQVREKHLSASELLGLVRRILGIAAGSGTRVLVNGRVDIALSAGAGGVHLPSHSVLPGTWKRITPPDFVFGVSSHSLDEVSGAAQDQADFIFYGPIFSTPGKGPPVGLDALREAARISKVPVWALGGIRKENAAACLRAGAAGVAAISWFQSE